MTVVLKVLFGIIGLAIGGWAGFWIVGLGGEAILPPPDGPLAEPGTGMGVAFAAIFVGVPIGALVGCWLGVLAARKIAGGAGGGKK
jgi:hypothetical protein